MAKSRSGLAKRGLSLLKSNNEEEAKRWLESLRAKFELDETGRVCEVNLRYTRVTDAGLVHLKELTNLDALDLESTEVTDAGLVHLEGLVRAELAEASPTRFMGCRLTPNVLA